jgi:hypothetical protein
LYARDLVFSLYARDSSTLKSWTVISIITYRVKTKLERNKSKVDAYMHAVGRLFWSTCVKHLQTSKIDRYETAKFNKHLKLLGLKYAKMQKTFLTRHCQVHKIAAQKNFFCKIFSSMKIVREYLESQFFQKIHLGSSILCQTLYLFSSQMYTTMSVNIY